MDTLFQVPSIGAILFSEILNPFYCFQIFSVILWLIDEYVTYAMSIIFMTTASMVTTLYQGRIFKVVRSWWIFPRWESSKSKKRAASFERYGWEEQYFKSYLLPWFRMGRTFI